MLNADSYEVILVSVFPGEQLGHSQCKAGTITEPGQQLGQLLGQNWSTGTLSGSGHCQKCNQDNYWASIWADPVSTEPGH